MIDLLGMPDFSGNTVDNGRLKLIQVLGSGGFGVVYKAIDKSGPTLRYCAAKCLRATASDREQLKRYDLEIYLHQKVSDHENILTFHRVFRDGNFLFLVLELCDGGDLFNAITRYNLYVGHEERIKAAILQIIDAVQYCHDHSVFHRDIKPENILVGRDGLDIRLADFGLATEKPTSTVYGVGSLTNMPPGDVALMSSSFHFLTNKAESMTKKRGQESHSTLYSDIWAIGVIMVNIVASITPWDVAVIDDDKRYAKFCADGRLATDDVVSSAFSDLLRRIFKLNPLERINLRQLREAILNIDTFYIQRALEDDSGVPHPFAYYSSEIHNARSNSGSSNTSYGIRYEGYQSQDHDPYLFSNPSSASTHSIEVTNAGLQATAIKIDLQNVISRDSSPSPPASSGLDTSLGQFLARYVVFGSMADASAATTSTASSGSTSDSRVLVTPETHACDPDIEIPALGSEEGVDKSKLSKLGVVAKGSHRLGKVPTRALCRVKAAVRRVRALASSKKLSEV